MTEQKYEVALEENYQIHQTDAQELVTNMSGSDSLMFTTLDTNDIINVLKASEVMAQPDGRLRDFVNTDIVISDIIMHPIKQVDQNTGMEVDVPRIILIDSEGKSYNCVSKGIYNALVSNILPVMNKLGYKNVLVVKVVEGSAGPTNRYLTLVVQSEKTLANLKKAQAETK